MIPLRCDTVQKRIAPATLLLIAVCCLVYAFLGRWRISSIGFVPLDFIHALLHPGRGTVTALAAVVTAFFVHANILHLVSNMWYLWIFGNAVEYHLDFLRFFGLYLLCGGMSMIAQALYAPLSAIPVVGASGAIAGVMGIHFVLLPFSRILTWIPPIFLVRIPSFVFLLIWCYVQYVNAGSIQAAPVAWWAHIGGFITGVVCGTVMRASGSSSQIRAKHRKKS